MDSCYGSVVVAGSEVVEVDVVSASSEGLVVVLESSIALVELLVPSEPTVAPVVTSGSAEVLVVVVVLAVSISATPLVASALASSASTAVVVGGILVAAVVTSVSAAPSSPEPEC